MTTDRPGSPAVSPVPSQEKIREALALIKDYDRNHVGATVVNPFTFQLRELLESAVSPVPPTAREISKEWLDELIEGVAKSESTFGRRDRWAVTKFRDAILSAPSGPLSDPEREIDDDHYTYPDYHDKDRSVRPLWTEGETK